MKPKWINFETKDLTVKQIMERTGRPQSTVAVALAKYKLPYTRKKLNKLTDEQKSKILKLAHPNKSGWCIAKEIGSTRHAVYHFLKSQGLAYKGYQIAEEKQELFCWEKYPSGIY